MMNVQVIEAGQLFTLTAGAYSDYGVIAVCKALQTFNADELKAEYLVSRPEQAEEYHFQEYEFAAWLINTKKVAEEVPCANFHLGSYSCADIRVRRPEKSLELSRYEGK